MQLSANFSLQEMVKSDVAVRHGIDNTTADETIIENLRLVCQNILQPVRDHYGVPFTPNSGFRCLALNTALKGSASSQHMAGQAVDFEVPTVTNYDLAEWVRDNLVYDQLILECYEPGVPKSGWVHCSYIADTPRRLVRTYANRQYRDGLIA